MLHRIALGLLFAFVCIGVLPIAAQQMPSGVLIVRPEDRPMVAEATAPCGSIRYLVDSEHTGGAFSMVESNECSKPMTNVHRHHSMDEAFYVVDGTLTIYVDNKFHVLKPGSYFFVPRGTPHAQGNPCMVPNKVLVTFTPGGFERLLNDRGEVVKTTRSAVPNTWQPWPSGTAYSVRHWRPHRSHRRHALDRWGSRTRTFTSNGGAA